MAQVRVSEGVLEGEIVQNEYGGSYYSFKGIPFAQPPIGELRFKAPQPPKPWDGIRSAKEFGSVCYQVDMFKKNPPEGCEDCLYLNVYTPNLKPDKPLAVMVWIHGGAFLSGSGDDDFYGPEFLVRNDVILVTINYRLDALGFLCLDTENIPGNAGMKDQVAALRWVKNNISNFGGDPNNVTIFGESAGGASVTFHLFSPMSKGLFKRAIAQSGTCTCWWAQSFEPRERALALAKKLGFCSQDDKALYEFFKSQPFESIMLASVPLTYEEASKIYVNIQHSIVKEKSFGNNERFFYEGVLDNGIHDGVEVMTGYVENEAIGIFGISGEFEKKFEQANIFLEYLVPKDIALQSTIAEQFEVGRKMKSFYFKENEPLSMKQLDQMLKYASCDLFVYKTIEMQKNISKTNKAYLYKFTCKSERNVFAKIFGVEELTNGKTVVSHCDDLGYLFPINFMQQCIKKESKEWKYIEQVTKLWTDFAKYGNPTPDKSLGVQWLPYSEKEQNYLDIGEQLVVGKSPDREEIEFWENIYKQYYYQK